MIPTLMLFGLVFGRWWRFALATAAVAWPVALAVTDVMSPEWGLITAAMLAVANTLAGVLLHQGASWCVRHARIQLRRPPVPNDHTPVAGSRIK